jgi:hypothetical protein
VLDKRRLKTQMVDVGRGRRGEGGGRDGVAVLDRVCRRERGRQKRTPLRSVCSKRCWGEERRREIIRFASKEGRGWCGCGSAGVGVGVVVQRGSGSGIGSHSSGVLVVVVVVVVVDVRVGMGIRRRGGCRTDISRPGVAARLRDWGGEQTKHR